MAADFHQSEQAEEQERVYKTGAIVSFWPNRGSGILSLLLYLSFRRKPLDLMNTQGEAITQGPECQVAEIIGDHSRGYLPHY